MGATRSTAFDFHNEAGHTLYVRIRHLHKYFSQGYLENNVLNTEEQYRINMKRSSDFGKKRKPRRTLVDLCLVDRSRSNDFHTHHIETFEFEIHRRSRSTGRVYSDFLY